MKSNGQTPEVSIIVPTYNSRKTISACLKSIADQSYSSYEIIIVDNHSDDETLKIAGRFSVTAIRQRGTPAFARNVGISYSKGKYVLLLDSDQILSQNVIAECVKKCAINDVQMVRIPEVFIGKGFWSRCSAIWKNYYVKNEESSLNEDEISEGEPRFFVKEWLMRVGMLDGNLLWGEDSSLYEKLKTAKAKEEKCTSRIYHMELSSLKEIMTKNIRYGLSMPVFVQQTKRHVFRALLRHSFVTIREILQDFRREPGVILGCILLLGLKTYAIGFSFPSGWLSTKYETA